MTISDERVERACIVFTCETEDEWNASPENYKDLIREDMRSALEAVDPGPPVYLALDLWQSLNLPLGEFDGYYERNGWADTWSNLNHEIRLRSGATACGNTDSGEPCVLLTPNHPVHHGFSDVGSFEPLPIPEQSDLSDPETGVAYIAMIRVQVDIEYDGGINTPDAYEPPYEYLVVRDAEVVTILRGKDYRTAAEMISYGGFDYGDPDGLMLSEVIKAGGLREDGEYDQ